MRWFVKVGTREFTIDVDGADVRLDGEPVLAELRNVPGTPTRMLVVGDRTFTLIAAPHETGEGWRLDVDGARHHAIAVDERTRAIREMAGAGAGPAGPRPVVAPMPGMVLRVDVAAGDHVREGQGVVIVEAMKMENELKASAGGVVSRVLVRSGDTVEKGQVLVEFTSAEAEDA
jgi:pyruvate carboxylase subunit B